MREELILLRDELKALKECQTRYIGLAITSVGVIFAYLAESLGDVTKYFTTQTDPIINPAYLTPLVIILPISCIFFNKATTVTRIIGYYQILEDFNLERNDGKFIGWENSLRKLREYGREREKIIKQDFGRIVLWEKLSRIKKIEYFFRIFGFNMEPLHGVEAIGNNIYQNNPPRDLNKPQTYWELVYATFFAMSTLCFILAIGPAIVWNAKHLITDISLQTNKFDLFLNLTANMFRANRFGFLLTWVFLSISIYIFRFNLKTLYQLERGFHSYYANYVLWDALLIKQIDKKVIDNHINDLSSERESGNQEITRNEIPKSQKRMILFFVIYLGGMLLITFI